MIFNMILINMKQYVSHLIILQQESGLLPHPPAPLSPALLRRSGYAKAKGEGLG